MSFQLTEDEIDYDELIDYELSCIHESDSDLDDKAFLENNIADTDSYDVVLDKISKAHEEFYKSCFDNTNDDDDNTNDRSGDTLNDSLDNRTMRILKSYNLSYENFVMTLSKVNTELEEDSDVITSLELNTKIDSTVTDSTQAWISHENALQQINKEKWSQYDSFYKKFNERCTSARTLAQKELENQVVQETKRREILQNNLESELQLLEQRWKLDEAENKLKMIEIDAEIEEEKQVMVMLQTEVEEVVNVKHNMAAIMIQKTFRRYRIRKRIGAEIDEIREKVRQKLFNRKFIISEKENQKKRALELRKWKKDREKQSNSNKVKEDYNKFEVVEEEQFQENSDMFNQGNNNNMFPFLGIIELVSGGNEVICGNDEKEIDPGVVLRKDVEVEETVIMKNVDYSDEKSEENINDITEKEMEVVNVEENVEILKENCDECIVTSSVCMLHNDIRDCEFDSRYTEITTLNSEPNESGLLNIDKEDRGSQNEDYKDITQGIIECSEFEEKDLSEVNSTDVTDMGMKENESKVESDYSKEDYQNDRSEDLINDKQSEMDIFVIEQEDRCSQHEDNKDTAHGIVQANGTVEENDHAEISRINATEIVDSIKKNVSKVEIYCSTEDCEKEKIEELTSSNSKLIGERIINANVDLGIRKELPYENNCELPSSSHTEEYLNKILIGNDILIKICVSWMNHVMEKRENMNAVHEIQGKTLSVPKHLIQSSNLVQILYNNKPGKVILASDEETISSCTSLFIKDKELMSIKDLHRTCALLQYLAVNDTSLTSVHGEDLPDSVVYLNLDRNKLEWTYFGSSGPNCLTSISLRFNDLTNLPSATFSGCQSLISLDLSNNSFLSIANIFNDTEPLMNLCYLNVSCNVLSSMETLAHHCPRLTNLILSNNHIKQWKSNENFPTLVECNLSNNSLSHVERLLDTPLLIKLNLSNNNIVCLKEFTQSWMPCLSELCVDSNKLSMLPAMHFPLIQSISVKRNYLTDNVNVDAVFENCPLISSINLSQNISIIGSSSRHFKDKVINDENGKLEYHLPCPVGEFATRCYDFVDGIQNKSTILANNLKSSNSMEMIHKHQYHFYRFVRDTVEDLSDWMIRFLRQDSDVNQKYTCVSKFPSYSLLDVDAVIKIQAFWKGYRVRKWYKSVLRDIRFDTEKSFEAFVAPDLSEFDENYFLGDWDTTCPILSDPKQAWVHSNRENLPSVRKSSRCEELNNIPPSSNASSCRLGSTDYKPTPMLGKKGIEIMKEWGFEDPNSAKWMLERAKRFRNKSEKTVKKPYQGTKNYFENSVVAPSTHCTQKVSPFEVTPVTTITLQPPGTAQSNNTHTKIYDWLIDSDPAPLPVTQNKSFLPAIDKDCVTNRAVLTTTRRDSSSTKLPPINVVFTYK